MENQDVNNNSDKIINENKQLQELDDSFISGDPTYYFAKKLEIRIKALEDRVTELEKETKFSNPFNGMKFLNRKEREE